METNMSEPMGEGWTREGHGGFSAVFAEIWRREEEGGPAFAMWVEPRHLDVTGHMARGALLSFADHVVGSAGIKVLGISQVTIQLQVSFIAPIREGDLLLGHGEMVGTAGDITHLRGKLSVDGKTVAVADGRWKAVRPLA